MFLGQSLENLNFPFKTQKIPGFFFSVFFWVKKFTKSGPRFHWHGPAATLRAGPASTGSGCSHRASTRGAGDGHPGAGNRGIFSMERLGVWTSSWGFFGPWGHGKQRWRSMDKLWLSAAPGVFFRMTFQQKLGFTVIDLPYLL